MRSRKAPTPTELTQFSTVIFPLWRRRRTAGEGWLSATAFPSGVRTIPVEATESIAPVVFYRREFREGSGGAGKQRGGLGQVIELGGAGAAPIALLCNFERVRNPARGRNGGGPGAAGEVALRSGRPIRPKGRQTVPPRDAIRLRLPGGGGFGDPRARDPQRVLDDVLDGLITAGRSAARLRRGCGRTRPTRYAGDGAGAGATRPCRLGWSRPLYAGKRCWPRRRRRYI